VRARIDARQPTASQRTVDITMDIAIASHIQGAIVHADTPIFGAHRQRRISGAP